MLKKESKDCFYSGTDLGAFLSGGETVFKLWSPGAERVILNLYEDGADSEVQEQMELLPEADGVWCGRVPEDRNGWYYDYEIERDGRRTRTADPYARACGVNGRRSMVIRLADTDPEGWENDRAPEKGPETIVYELHVKEYSADPEGGFPEAVRGTYLAFEEDDTTLHNDGVHATGMKYLRQLGVTHIQLMPIYDYGSVDEAGSKEQFNWGYDPLNYWVPEGSYSTDAFHGEVRIRECKRMIQSLHKNGFRVIMDVVYNHTYTHDSWLERTVPGYYYRTEEDGTLCNGSECGNDVASERPMCSRYILDSVLYWAREYHIDGFRFDLMGLLDTALLNRIQACLDEEFGEGEKLLYGEPWSARPSNLEPGSFPADKAHIRLLNEKIGVFCDCVRDAVKGHVFDLHVPGFVNGGKGFEEEILRSVTAWCGKTEEERAAGEGFAPKAPSQIVTYISAHDNLTLWDKLAVTLKPAGGFATEDEAFYKSYRLAAAIYLTCQGHLFMLSGEEFGRTKDGIEDSYCSPLAVNRLDWTLAVRRERLVSYYRGLLALRKQLPCLCDKSADAYRRLLGSEVREGFVSWRMDNTKQGRTKENAAEAGRVYKETQIPEEGNRPDKYSEIFTAYNANREAVCITLPEGEWAVLVKGEDSHCWEKPQSLSDNQMCVEGLSAVVLGRRK